MIIKIHKFPSLIAINFRSLFLDTLLFLYFVTLHADQLQCKLFNYSIRLNNVIALTLLLIVLTALKQKAFALPKWILLSFGFLTSSLFLSLILSPFKQISTLFFILYLVTFVGYFFLPYFLMITFSSVRILRLYFLSFLCVGTYALMQFVFSMFGYLDPFAEQLIGGLLSRPNAFSYEPSFYALYMTPFVMMTNLHFLTSSKNHFFIFKRVGYKELLFVNLLYLISTTTSALFGYVVFFFTLFFLTHFTFLKERFGFLRKSLLKLGIALISGTFFAFLLFPKFMKMYFLKFFFHGTSHASFLERWIGIKNAWHLFLQNPLFGVGYGAYREVLHEKWLAQDKGFLFLVDEASVRSDYILKFFEPMNVFTEILASLGIIGLIACCFFLFNFYKASKRAFLDEKAHLIFLMLTSVLVTLVVLQFNQGVLRTYIWTHLALVAAILNPKCKVFT